MRCGVQGTLSILIRDAPAGQTTGVSEQEVYQRFAQFGEIKSVYPSDKRPDVKFIEFYDSRVRWLVPSPAWVSAFMRMPD